MWGRLPRRKEEVKEKRRTFLCLGSCSRLQSSCEGERRHFKASSTVDKLTLCCPSIPHWPHKHFRSLMSCWLSSVQR